MAQSYIQAMADALAQFDNHRQSSSFYSQIAWGGLQQTKEWFALPSKDIDTIAIHNTIAHEEFGDSQAKGLRCLN